MVKLGLTLVFIGALLFAANPYGMRFFSSFALFIEETRWLSLYIVLIGGAIQFKRLFIFLPSILLFLAILLSIDRYPSKSFNLPEGSLILESMEEGVEIKIWEKDEAIFALIKTKSLSEPSLWKSYRAVRRVAAYLRNKNDQKILAVLDLPFNRGARLYSIFGEVSRLKGFKDGKTIAYSNL